jgi:hypothetical protein
MSDIVYKLIYVGGMWGKMVGEFACGRDRGQVRAMGKSMWNERSRSGLYTLGASFIGDSEVAADLIILSLS